LLGIGEIDQLQRATAFIGRGRDGAEVSDNRGNYPAAHRFWQRDSRQILIRRFHTALSILHNLRCKSPVLIIPGPIPQIPDGQLHLIGRALHVIVVQAIGDSKPYLRGCPG
jgi:hypothetical protein